MRCLRPAFTAFALLALAILALAAAPRAGAQIDVPLQIVNLGNVTAPEYKLGIYVGLGGNAPLLYEFDTGSAGLFAAYNATSDNWASTSTLQPMNMTYSSGITYNTTVVNTNITLYGADNLTTPVASLSANVGQIDVATGSDVANWDTDLGNGTAPLYGNFYGDFGMALYRQLGDDPVPTVVNAAPPSIYSLIPQLGANTSVLGAGFIISMGNYSNPTPTLQIGLTAADKALFSYTVAMNGPSQLEATGTIPVNGAPAGSLQVISGNLALTANGTVTSQPIGAVLDTGAPTSELHPYGNVTDPDGSITNVLFNGTDATTGLIDTLMQYDTADPLKGLNGIGISNVVNPLYPDNGYLNTGLNIFFQNDIMFDLQDGVVGFAPVPEPADTATFLGLGGLLAFAVQRARRARRKAAGG